MKGNIFKSFVYSSAVIIIMGLGMLAGMVMPIYATPQVITQTVIKEVPSQPIIKTVEVPVYVDREVQVEKIVEKPVEVVKEVTKIIEVPIKLKDFQSLDELTEWLVKNNPKMVYLTANSDGGINLNSVFNVCCTQAVELQKKAEAQGYRLDKEVITSEEYLKYYGKSNNGLSHAVCMTWIGKDIYFIEPYEPLNKVWLAGYREDKE
jgi:hypothetical protein